MSFAMKTLRVCLTAVLLLAQSGPPAVAQPQEKAPAGLPSPARGPRDAHEVESFFDSVLGKLIVQDEQSPGAVVVVVRNGRILFAKGYGYANLEKKTPVLPEKTLFYLASVTKSFTATAVMQQVELGRLDLHADVNTYLKTFQVQPRFGKPVTLTNLLTHTAGLDDKNVGYVAATQAASRSLSEYLAHEMPPQVMPPGLAIAYSNHGYGLAGHLLEIASGEVYSDYIEQHILRPLGMNRSTAHIPLPVALASDLATGYQYDSIEKRFAPQPLGFRNLPPAGTISATATDMARFLIAHLQDGEFEGTHILQPQTAQTMHTRQFTHHPRLPGIAFGFYERFRGAVRMLEHPGGYLGFATSMTLVPEDGVGIFLATNTTSAYTVNQTLQGFLDHYYPMPPPPQASKKPTPAGSQNLTRLEGAYHLTRYSRTTIEKIATWDGQIRVTATPQGTLVIQPRNRPATEWALIEPLLFHKVDGSDLLAFREDQHGNITHFFLTLPNGFPGAFERLPWYESVAVQVPLALGLSAVLLSTVVVYPITLSITAWRRRKRGVTRDRKQGQALAVAAVMLTGALAVAFVLGLDVLLGNSTYRLRLVYGMTPEMNALLWIPIAVTALVPVLIFFAGRAWRQSRGSLLNRIYYSLVALAAILQVVFYLQWNFLRWRF